MSSTNDDVTQLLAKAQSGDVAKREELFRIVEREMRQIAQNFMRKERPDHTLQATALVDDAFLKLVGTNESQRWEDRKHFFRVGARVMRRILIDHERQRAAQKRGGGIQRAELEPEMIPSRSQAFDDLLALDEALKKLSEFDSRQAEIIELRYFGQYTINEIADLVDVSASTVKNEIATARMWLSREMKRGTTE
ncbi:MAG: sigma-70 family RNA polymerase sigma factor [Planctomycetaceae bacterium]|nr:sigma-70 family RNA polymerase sigma factor [Planctomycetales bacterium]MCB9924169.1 sigma-70 family RNA polymerase sigma factor [Planctomycetaceae bacterium]